MNKVILCGNLTRDVETRDTATTTVARVGIAVRKPFSKDNAADFFNLVAFGKSAEFLSKYFAKGSRILIDGHLQTSRYKDKSGVERTATDIIVDQIEFAGSNKKAAPKGDFGGDYVPNEDTPF